MNYEDYIALERVSSIKAVDLMLYRHYSFMFDQNCVDCEAFL